MKNEQITLQEFLNSSNKYRVTKLLNGESTTVSNLYDSLIANSLPKEETVLKWHHLLIDYIAQKDAIFFIRRYASASNKQWDLIRRGFLTEYIDGLQYVFCDNYLAHYFYLMALNDFVPTIEEFNELIKTRQFPYGFMQTSAEKPFQAFPKGKSVNINSSGWKLAHLYSVNQNDYNFDYKKQSKHLFPIGNQNDWKIQDGKNYPLRYLNDVSTENLRNVTIAHFLRLVHPINYFLVPKTKLSNIDIGENYNVINYMREKTNERFKNIFLDFQELILSKKNDLVIDNSFQFHLKYGPNHVNSNLVSKKIKIKKKTESTEPSNSNVDSLDVHLLVIKAYLVANLSYRKIEIEFLNIESQERGGGFVAKKIINSYGITKSHKGTITKENIESVINENKGILKSTLIKLHEYLVNDNNSNLFKIRSQDA